MKVARENHRESSKIRVGHSLSRSNNVAKWTMGPGPYEHMFLYKPCTRLGMRLIIYLFLHDFTLIIISLAALQHLICYKSDRPVFAGAF